MIMPFGNYLVVERAERTTESDGGIILTESTTERPSEGVVKAVGSEVKYAKVGDTVLFNKYAGALVMDKDNENLILQEEDLFGRRGGI